MYEIELNSRYALPDEQRTRLTEAVRRILKGANVETAEVSLAVVDDETIHELNRRHLNHDYATDVLSFLLEEGPKHLEGEIIVSWDHARVLAAQLGWEAENELLLYVIHGALHLVGHEDHDPEDRQRMRRAENEQLESWGLPLPPSPPTETPRSQEIPDPSVARKDVSSAGASHARGRS